MNEIELVYEQGLNEETKGFFMNEWPSANKEVFNFTDQSKWKMEERIITARKATEIIGIAQFRIIGGVGYLSTLLIKENYRGKGSIGKTLLAEFECLATDKNCHKLSLKSYKDSRSTKFFISQGYVVEAELKNDIHGIDWVMLAKFL